MLGGAFDVSRPAKKVVNVSLAFLRTFFLAVCDIHSVWAVLLVILNEVEVCPLFAALRVFCHTQHIRNMHATCMLRACCVCVAYDKTHTTLQIVDKLLPHSKLPAKPPKHCECHRQPKKTCEEKQAKR